MASRQTSSPRVRLPFQPYPYQVKGIAFLMPRHAALLADEMGLGKTAQVIALLQQPEGATLQTIVKATGWQTQSVRGFVSGQLKKKMGLKVRSSQRDGERVYSIKH